MKYIKLIFSYPLIIIIKLYKLIISPHLPNACRFHPTCSNYSVEALKRFGPIRGSILTIYRIIRCNPIGGHGYDPVPEKWNYYFKKKAKINV